MGMWVGGTGEGEAGVSGDKRCLNLETAFVVRPDQREKGENYGKAQWNCC